MKDLDFLIFKISVTENQLVDSAKQLITLALTCAFSGFFLFTPESTPPSSKRMKTRVVRRSGKLERWFSSDPDLINKYLQETSRKMINTPKVISLNWLKEKKLMEVKKVVEGSNAEMFSGDVWKNLSRLGKGFLPQSPI